MGTIATAKVKIASPESVLAAAEEAPAAFRIDPYYPAIARMREKGHSWRGIALWLREFNIQISYVHLRRLFGAEGQRRAPDLPVPPPPATGAGPAPSADEEKWTRL
jgi:hypothetical protein